MTKLFGTDGIRGEAGMYPLDEATVHAIGRSMGQKLQSRLGRAARFLLGRDTRESGALIEAAFRSGAEAVGAVCESAGVITTPGVAFLTRKFDFDLGIVISASHNPFQDNGIKAFLPTGKKIDDELERSVEADVTQARTSLQGQIATALDSSRAPQFQAEYLEHLTATYDGLSLDGYKIVVDCAHGAASHLAPQLFREVGAELISINDRPDGRNINRDCGSLHLDQLEMKVRETQADLGVAFDGDADRALFVDERGNTVDGDATLWILAKAMQDRGELGSGKVVATVMSNVGLEIALASRGIQLIRTSVGDKYVLDELLRSDVEIGGEQSGHIIFPRRSLVGDGMMTALSVFEAVASSGGRLSDLIEGFKRYPQILVNVRVGQKKPFHEVEAIREAYSETEQVLAGTGRLLLRYSGTENLARVMIEGQDQHEIEGLANSLAETIRTALS